MDLRRKVGKATVSAREETSTYLKVFKANNPIGYLRYRDPAIWDLSAKCDGYTVKGSFDSKDKAFDLYCEVVKIIQARAQLRKRIEHLTSTSESSDPHVRSLTSYLQSLTWASGPNRGLTQAQVIQTQPERLPQRIQEFDRDAMRFDEFVQPTIRVS